MAKYGLVSPKDGFNSFLKDISQEIQARQTRRQEQLREVDRLKVAIAELDDQQKFVNEKVCHFVRLRLTCFRSKTSKTTWIAFVRPLLPDSKLRLRSSNTRNCSKRRSLRIPKFLLLNNLKSFLKSLTPNPKSSKSKERSRESLASQGKQYLLLILISVRNFTLELQDLLGAKEHNESTFDTEKGLELYVSSTLIFLNKQFFNSKK